MTNTITKTVLLNSILCIMFSTANMTFGMEKNIIEYTALYEQRENNPCFFNLVCSGCLQQPDKTLTFKKEDLSKIIQEKHIPSNQLISFNRTLKNTLEKHSPWFKKDEEAGSVFIAEIIENDNKKFKRITFINNDQKNQEISDELLKQPITNKNYYSAAAWQATKGFLSTGLFTVALLAILYKCNSLPKELAQIISVYFK
jgi:hypothetical protein